MTTGTSWRIRGDQLQSCNCNYGCPCQFGSDPTRGSCEGVIGFHIQEGNYGNTRLDGLNAVMYLRAPGNMTKGGWTAGVYLDQRANQEQQQALETILSGQGGGLFAALTGMIEKPLPPKRVPISFETVDGEYRFTVPGLLEMGSERIPSPMPGQPSLNAKISDAALPIFAGPSNVRRSSVYKLTDPNLSFEHSGHSALTGQFDLKGP